MKWTDIYIPPRPQSSPRHPNHLHERISRLSLHPDAPFHIGVPMLSTFSGKHDITLLRTSQVAPGWDGSTPILLDFNGVMFSNFVITLGRCTREKTAFLRDITSDPEETLLGPHFITVQDGSDLTLKDPSHSCKDDHVKAGTTLRWQLQYGIPIPELRARMTPQYIQISLLRSRIGDNSASILDVHLDVVSYFDLPENRVSPFLRTVYALIILIFHLKFP